MEKAKLSLVRECLRQGLRALAVPLLAWALPRVPVRAADGQEIRPRNAATWPAPAPGFVKRFPLRAREHEIGFTLRDPHLESDRAAWRWQSNKLSGKIELTVRQTSQEARQALRQTLWLWNLGPAIWAPDGQMVGDVSWGHGPSGMRFRDGRKPKVEPRPPLCYFCRRNVVVWLTADQVDNDAEFVRLARAIVQAIDSEEVVTKPTQVSCPVVEVELARRLRIGEEEGLRVIAREPKGAKLSYACWVRPQQSLKVQDSWHQVTAAGEARFTLKPEREGNIELVVSVVDEDGMTTTTVQSSRCVQVVEVDPTSWEAFVTRPLVLGLLVVLVLLSGFLVLYRRQLRRRRQRPTTVSARHCARGHGRGSGTTRLARHFRSVA